ncbi:MAG: hypothetical protein B7Z55_19885, partial [Planctomycetales bacterium 12-60-4]
MALHAVLWHELCVAQPPTPSASAETEEVPLPKLGALTIPTTEELLRGKPTDWLVLQNQDVIFVEPVKPRPGTLETLKAELQRIQVTLIDDREDPEYVIETRFINQIVYFEDHILQRAGLLLNKGDLHPAYELLMFLDRRQRGWPGFDDLYHRFLFLEADQLAKSGEFERALVNAESLYARAADYADLSRLFGRILDGLVTRCIADDDFRQARHFLGRLQRLIPDHGTASKWSKSLEGQAGDILQQARQAQQRHDDRQAALLVDRAASIWPDLATLKEAHRELIDRYQIIRVGVVADQSRSGSYPFETEVIDRRRRLCELP